MKNLPKAVNLLSCLLKLQIEALNRGSMEVKHKKQTETLLQGFYLSMDYQRPSTHQKLLESVKDQVYLLTD